MAHLDVILQNHSMPDKKLTHDEITRNKQMVRYLKPWVKLLQLTQTEVAELMNVSDGTFSKWLSGTQSMTVSQFQSLADVLGLPPEALLSPPGDTNAARRMTRLLALAREMTDSDLAAIEVLLSRGKAHN